MSELTTNDDLSVSVPLPVGTMTVPASQVPTGEQLHAPSTKVVDDDIDITVVARYPHEMQAAQQHLIEWCKRKITVCEQEAADLQANYELAKRSKWKSSSLLHHATKAGKLVVYYRKILQALEAGYSIIPNFPVELFAVRTNRKNPDRQTRKFPSQIADVDTQGLPPGEGKWVDNEPVSRPRENLVVDNKTGETEKSTYWVSERFDEYIDFPFTLAKPEVLQATQRAMTEKLFDDLGVLPARRRNTDPVVVGRIKDPRSTTHDKRYITFLIAWFVDTRTI